MALVGAAVVGVTSLSLAKANSIAINAMGSNKVALQAQQYAAAKGELIRATKYSDLTAQGKSNIGNTDFQDEVIVGAETTVDSTTKKKEVTIRVYKIGEESPRSSIIVTRYNKSLDNSIPSGTIVTWYGNLGNIPSGFALCDGNNGTPDLRNRFVVGAGSSYALGNTGGANTVTLSVAQMPSHNHSASVGNANTSYLSKVQFTNSWSYSNPVSLSTNGTSAWCQAGEESGGGYDATMRFTNSLVSHGHSISINSNGSGSAHENRPPYYALYYIMKL